ncbi:hypothetical protein B0H14DRAFT_3444464 [Mycena olivaceomarginata]|nr:hypothetical protein B0H14DRAFT_3444464 [Mycena olivaceomarginata]
MFVKGAEFDIPNSWVSSTFAGLERVNPFIAELEKLNVYDDEDNIALHIEHSESITNEIAAIISLASASPPSRRKLVIKRKGDTEPVFLDLPSPLTEPLHYLLLLPHGALGWSPKRLRSDGKTFSQARCYRTWFFMNAEQMSVFSRPTGEYLIDAWSTIEEARLTYIRHNQHSDPDDSEYVGTGDEEPVDDDISLLIHEFDVYAAIVHLAVIVPTLHAVVKPRYDPWGGLILENAGTVLSEYDIRWDDLSLTHQEKILLYNTLHQLHSASVVHGDVAPRNILCRPCGAFCLVDFDRSTLNHKRGAVPSMEEYKQVQSDARHRASSLRSLYRSPSPVLMQPGPGQSHTYPSRAAAAAQAPALSPPVTSEGSDGDAQRRVPTTASASQQSPNPAPATASPSASQTGSGSGPVASTSKSS